MHMIITFETDCLFDKVQYNLSDRFKRNITSKYKLDYEYPIMLQKWANANKIKKWRSAMLQNESIIYTFW